METVWFIEDTSNQKWYAWNLVPFEHSSLHGILSSPKEEDYWTNDPQMAVRFKHPKEAFEKMGFHVIEASDGEHGLRLLEELYEAHGENISKKLRLIASDIEMPRMDGFHFAARIKEDPRFKMVPIIFNSSISDHFSEMRGKEAGGEAYLVKFDANLFYDEVARVVRAHIQ